MSFVENYHMIEQILAAVANLACFSTPRICSTENRCFFIGNFLSPRGCGHGRRLTFTVVQEGRGRSLLIGTNNPTGTKDQVGKGDGDN